MFRRLAGNRRKILATWATYLKETTIQKQITQKRKETVYHKLTKLGKDRWISCTLEKLKSYVFFAHLDNIQCATELHCHPAERNPWPLWEVRWAAFPLTCTSLPKANGTYHETFHSISSAANFLPDMKKHTVLKHSTSCHSHQGPLAQLSTTLKTRRDPGSWQHPFSVSQQFFSTAFSFYHLTLSHMIPMRWQGNSADLFLQMRKGSSHLWNQTY